MNTSCGPTTSSGCTPSKTGTTTWWAAMCPQSPVLPMASMTGIPRIRPSGRLGRWRTPTSTGRSGRRSPSGRSSAGICGRSRASCRARGRPGSLAAAAAVCPVRGTTGGRRTCWTAWSTPSCARPRPAARRSSRRSSAASGCATAVSGYQPVYDDIAWLGLAVQRAGGLAGRADALGRRAATGRSTAAGPRTAAAASGGGAARTAAQERARERPGGDPAGPRRPDRIRRARSPTGWPRRSSTRIRAGPRRRPVGAGRLGRRGRPPSSPTARACTWAPASSSPHRDGHQRWGDRAVALVDAVKQRFATPDGVAARLRRRRRRALRPGIARPLPRRRGAAPARADRRRPAGWCWPCAEQAWLGRLETTRRAGVLRRLGACRPRGRAGGCRRPTSRCSWPAGWCWRPRPGCSGPATCRSSPYCLACAPRLRGLARRARRNSTIIGRIETSTTRIRISSMLLAHERDLAEPEPEQRDAGGPGDAADERVDEVALRVHLADAGHHRDERAHDRHEPAEHDGAVAVLLEELVGLRDVLGLEQPRLRLVEDGRARPRARCRTRRRCR